MAQNSKKMIILLDETADGLGYVDGFEVATSISGKAPDDLVDVVTLASSSQAFEEEQLDESTIINQDAGFITNVTEDEAKKYEGKAGVLEIIEDIPVYATQEDLFEPYEFGEPDITPEEVEALEADPYPEWNPEEDPDLLTAEQLRLLSQLEPDIAEDLDDEDMLASIAEVSGQQLQGLNISNEKLIKVILCALRCVAENVTSVEEINQDDIEAALTAAGMQSGISAQAAADVILPNLRLIYAHYAWRYSTGAGVRVAVVDTGIKPRHPDLRVYGGLSFISGTRWYDDNGHGTHVAGTIAALWNRRGIIGVAPRARLYAFKVLSRNGSGSLSGVLNGITACYRTRMHIVNLSLGSRVNTHAPSVYNRAYERVGRLLRSRGILAIAAAGNDRHRPVNNPARCPSYMAVSAIDNRRRLASFTNIGPQVEICAPGVNILSTYPLNTYKRLSGTSMATPHVTGVAALIKARHPSWHGDRIRRELQRTALDLGTPGRDWAFGYGQVNAYRAVR